MDLKIKDSLQATRSFALPKRLFFHLRPVQFYYAATSVQVFCVCILCECFLKVLCVSVCERLLNVADSVSK